MPSHSFRENLLLHYPEITSKSGEERICEVIAHEIAHQWFGNLVTPEDWKYLWLNESFATYFGYGVVDHYYPQWETWQQFLWGSTGSAMARDALGLGAPRAGEQARARRPRRQPGPDRHRAAPGGG